MPDLSPLLAADPAQVAGYRIAGRLGSGGQGVVYLGVDPAGEQVAVKMLRVEDDLSRTQFAKEVASARRVAPFCTAQILDFDVQSASPYVISEFIEGPSLQQFVRERGPLSGTRLQRLAVGTATALAAIHLAGVVHRDLKPANVMMSPEGPRVIDFGIARDLSSHTTVASQLFGTPAYMSPEQLRAERIGPPADLFSWASVIVFAATGRAPFETGHMMASINKIAHEEPDLTGVPADLQTVLRLCFSKQPQQRPTAQQALAMLLGRSVVADTPNASAVLAAASEFVEAAADSAEASLEADGETGREVGGEADREVGLICGQEISQSVPTWVPAASPAAPSKDSPVPRPVNRKGRTAATIGAVIVLVVAVLGIGIGIGVHASNAKATTTASPAIEARPKQGTSADVPSTDPHISAAPISEAPTPAKRQATQPETATTGVPNSTTTDPTQKVPAGTLPPALAGTWKGTVTEHSSSSADWQWLVQLDLTAGEKQPGTMQALDLDCTAYVSVTKAGTDTATLRAPVRDADNRNGTCSSLGVITMKLNAKSGTIAFNWQDMEDPTNAGTATLTRS